MTSRASGAIIVALSVIAIAGAAVLGAVRAAATWYVIDQTGTPGLLWLMSDWVDPVTLSPGDIVSWQVRASLDDPLGTLAMQVRREGELTARDDAVQVLIRQCSVEWVVSADGEAQCSRGRVDLLGPISLADPLFGPPAGSDDDTPVEAPVWDLGYIGHDGDEYFLITLWVADTYENRLDESLMGLGAAIGVGFLAEEAELLVAPPPGARGLPATGADGGVLLLLIGGIVGTLVGVRLVRS